MDGQNSLHHFETMVETIIYRIIFIPRSCRWCEMDSATIHSNQVVGDKRAFGSGSLSLKGNPFQNKWVRLKKTVPKRNFGKWKHGTKPA